MRRRTGWYLFALICLAAVGFLSAPVMKAGSTTVTVAPNPASGTVAVSVSDGGLNGKDISVICYEPGVTGAVSDIAANKSFIVYMNQYTVNGTVSFTFHVKKQPVAGEYTLVVSSEKGQEIKKFRLVENKPAEQSTAAPQGTSAPSASSAPSAPTISAAPGAAVKKLKAPAGVKAKSTAKKKVTVTWKKVKNAKGYFVSISTKKNGKYKVKLTVKGGSKKKAVLTGLKSKKTYYVKVSAYDTSGKKKVAGKNSRAVKVKVR